MAPASPLKRLARRVAKGPLERAGLAGLAAAAAVSAAALLLLCSASLRCSAAALAAAPRRLWAGGVSVAVAGSEEEEEDCDLFDGDWVRAGGGYPLYDSRACPFLDVGFRCSENGRPDAAYATWRWQPARCHLPRSVASIRVRSSLLLLGSACSTGSAATAALAFACLLDLAGVH